VSANQHERASGLGKKFYVNLLHIDSSITGEQSVSRQLTARIVEGLQKGSPDLNTTYRDLAKNPLPHHSLAHEAEHDRAAVAASLEEFLAADIVVIGAPMYNHGIPSQLKSWIDAFLVAGKTFRYGENGPVGLAGGKRVIIASARGGVYTDGPMSAHDFQETYLRDVFAFIGIPDVEFVRAEGVAMGPDARRDAIDAALRQADAAGNLLVAA
jgi:FMN-dependent NADH-azoreductase